MSAKQFYHEDRHQNFTIVEANSLAAAAAYLEVDVCDVRPATPGEVREFKVSNGRIIDATGEVSA